MNCAESLQSGVSGLLDVARQTFKETTEDVHRHVTEINGHQFPSYPDLIHAD